MAKLTRQIMKVFGQSAGANQIGVFGSLANGDVEYSTNVSTIQSLTQWLGGWFSAVVGVTSPAIEDMNALFYVITSQLTYLFQEGVPDWDAGTTYYTNSMVKSGGILYISNNEDNLNHAVTDATWWRAYGVPNSTPLTPNVSADPYQMFRTDSGKTFLIDTTNGATAFTLPDPSGQAFTNFTFTVKDTAGFASRTPITVAPFGAELIEGLNTTYSCGADFGVWTFIYDGTKWWLI